MPQTEAQHFFQHFDHCHLLDIVALCYHMQFQQNPMIFNWVSGRKPHFWPILGIFGLFLGQKIFPQKSGFVTYFHCIDPNFMQNKQRLMWTSETKYHKESRTREVNYSRSQEFEKSRIPEVNKSRNQEIKNSRIQEVKKSRSHEVNKSWTQEDMKSKTAWFRSQSPEFQDFQVLN